MDLTKKQLYERVKDLLSEKEFDTKIEQLIDEYDELFDEETAALIIVDELGRNTQNICKIGELDSRMETTISGRITRINNSRDFKRKNGTVGRVINLDISDDTGTCGLALWDKDVELVENKQIQVGTYLKIINGYVKDGFNGIEINVGRWGFIKINPDEKPKIDTSKLKNDKIIKGKLVVKEPSRAFFKDDGEFGFVTTIYLDTKDGRKKITVWDKQVKEIQKIKNGTQIELSDVDIKSKNDKTELHLNGRGTIKKL
jgi:replication factor A1